MTKMIFYAGAHKGEEIESLKRIGYDKIVAIEPQLELCKEMSLSFPDITVINAALWSSAGEMELHYGGYSTLATLVEKRTLNGKFKDYGWNYATKVKTITLDSIIEDHGIPKTISMDIEGAELHALYGLSHPIEEINFEYDMGFLNDAIGCLKRIEELSTYEYIIRSGESNVIEEGIDSERAVQILLSLSSSRPDMWGMINAINKEI